MTKSQNSATPKKLGRPSSFNQETANEICERIAQGESVRQICLSDHMPAMSVVFLWLSKIPEFSEQYARAREAQMDVYAQELTEIADANMSEQVEVSRAKLRVETRQWLMGKLKPKKYGQKVEIDAKVDANVAVRGLSETLSFLESVIPSGS